ncbi:hypothetical protein BDF19DRAFT_473780 [Syncephalis fuscata]|nr:hypothetical protein BDF19DRAFT_473780 [Syncephalis fuscata]
MEASDASTSTAVQDLKTVGSDDQLISIKWKLFDFQTVQSKCGPISSGQFYLPYCPNAITKSVMYTNRMSLVILYDLTDEEHKIHNGTSNASLSLFALKRPSRDGSLQHSFDAGNYNQLLPIDSSEQGHILWTRVIHNNTVTPLYSKKLIVVRDARKYNILDA